MKAPSTARIFCCPNLGDLPPGHPTAQNSFPVYWQRVRLVRDEGSHEQQALPEAAERIDKFVDVAAQRGLIGPVNEFGQLFGHGVDGEASLKSDAHGEMSAPHLSRGGLPYELGARLEHLLVQWGDILILAGDLASPKGSLECLIQELRQVGAISIKRFDQTEHGCIEAFDDLRKRLLANGPFAAAFIAAAIIVVLRAGCQALRDSGFFLGRSPSFSGVGEIFPSVIAIQDTFAGQPFKNLSDDLDKATLQRPGLGGSDQPSPLHLSPIDLIEHDMDDETFDVHEGTAGATSDVRELLAFDLLGRPIQCRHQQDGGVEVETLRQRRRCDDDLQNTLGQQGFQLTQERARQSAMVDGNSSLQARDGGMVLAQPLLADLQSAGN